MPRGVAVPLLPLPTFKTKSYQYNRITHKTHLMYYRTLAAHPCCQRCSGWSRIQLGGVVRYAANRQLTTCRCLSQRIARIPRGFRCT